MGDWNYDIDAFWFGANGCEFIAWKGSHQIFVYPCDDYSNPPTNCIQHNKRIETFEDFDDALINGIRYRIIAEVMPVDQRK